MLLIENPGNCSNFKRQRCVVGSRKSIDVNRNWPWLIYSLLSDIPSAVLGQQAADEHEELTRAVGNVEFIRNIRLAVMGEGDWSCSKECFSGRVALWLQTPPLVASFLLFLFLILPTRTLPDRALPLLFPILLFVSPPHHQTPN